MRVRGRLAGRRLAVVIGATLASLAPLSPALASSGQQYVAISGSGSSWSSVALLQWAQTLRADGIVINFNPDGSAAGRADYMDQQVDFAASDPPFRNGTDPFDSSGAEDPQVGYSYVPDTAGGTAFMYHLDVGGKLITNLRLSGETLMKIFTGQITNWDNPEITKDYGTQLPNLRIIPVIRSDGSGATYFFTRWMAHEFPAQWNAFCAKVSHGRVKPPCGQTEFYPQFPGSVAQDGSNNVATYISASYGQGAIGYDEYAYALNSHYPVVKVLNPAGYYVLPTASNVAVALTQAQIDEDPGSVNYLQQNLDNVYTFKDPRSYPLSSYSYLIVPKTGTKIPANFTPADGKTLSTYIDYFLCAGQQYSAELGYSPLPLNLVEGGLAQSSKIPGHIPTPNLSSGCDNPTLKDGKLVVLEDAPQPSPCDKVGEPLNCTVVHGKAVSGTAAAQQASTSPSPGATATAQAASAPGAAASGADPPAGPVTGQVVNVASTSGNSTVLGTLTAVEILVVVAVPPAVYALLRRRRSRVPR
ncbi:MAG TPA: substrate-binding domain-containing protein [Streptosporangiaceae bacterium]|nr:substrate-binding domain-containing protein [Streptosporangiaceae bacterium]